MITVKKFSDTRDDIKIEQHENIEQHGRPKARYLHVAVVKENESNGGFIEINLEEMSKAEKRWVTKSIWMVLTPQEANALKNALNQATFKEE